MMNDSQKCSIIEKDYLISKEVCKIIYNIPSIDRMYILAYIIHDNSLKKKVFNVWKITKAN